MSRRTTWPDTETVPPGTPVQSGSERGVVLRSEMISIANGTGLTYVEQVYVQWGRRTLEPVEHE